MSPMYLPAMLPASLPSPGDGVWHLGPLPVRAYALCIIAGVIAAVVIGDRRWVARGESAARSAILLSGRCRSESSVAGSITY